MSRSQPSVSLPQSGVGFGIGFRDGFRAGFRTGVGEEFGIGFRVQGSGFRVPGRVCFG